MAASRDGVVTWHGLGALELAFPCVTCSFIVVILLLCFCCCPLLLYQLRDEIGYDYLALLYSMLGLVLFGVVVEVLLVARRRGRLACCCRHDEEAPRTFSDHRGVLHNKPAVKAPLCDVHAPSPRGPPPAYDLVSINDPALVRQTSSAQPTSQLDVNTPLQLNMEGYASNNKPRSHSEYDKPEDWQGNKTSEPNDTNTLLRHHMNNRTVYHQINESLFSDAT